LAIGLKKPTEIELIRESSYIVYKTLEYLKTKVKSGITLSQLDKLGEEFILSHNARPSFKGLYGFSGSVCTSLNEVIIHGVPSDICLKDGDIIGLDVGVEKNSWYGDGAITVGVGEISDKNQDLINCAKDTLDYAISIIKVGMRFKELSLGIENFIRDRGYVPLRNYCGHGIGKKPHEEPEILNYLDGKNEKQGPKIKNGMVFCLEPMICQNEGEPDLLEDKWSVVSKDGKFGSHYEHTIAVIDGIAEVLTKEKNIG
jgi:methionyl aminopeptidase